MSDIPPPRYKVVERKGRITVTDTWADGGRPSLPPAPVPGTRVRSGAPGEDGSNVGLLWLRGRLVSLACLGASDDAGRPILTTNYHFDEKGPRSITLGAAGAARLGNWLLGTVFAGIALLIVFGLSPLAAIVGFGALGLAFTSANTTMRPSITRWLDALENERR